MLNFRTDLATERKEIYKKAEGIEGNIDGIESQKEEIYDIVNKYLKDIEITCKKDLYGRNRMIFVWNKID